MRTSATQAVTADRVDPQPAKSNRYELGLRQRNRGLDYSVAAFYTTSDLTSALDCSVTTEPCQPLREPRNYWCRRHAGLAHQFTVGRRRHCGLDEWRTHARQRREAARSEQ